MERTDNEHIERNGPNLHGSPSQHTRGPIDIIGRMATYKTCGPDPKTHPQIR